MWYVLYFVCICDDVHTQSSAWLGAGYPNVISEEKEEEKEPLIPSPLYLHLSTSSCFICREYKEPGTDLGQIALKLSSSAAIQNQNKVPFLQKLLAV